MAHLTKTYQGQLKPNSETKRQLQFISKGCNFVYNWALGKRIEVDKQGLRQPTKEQQTKELTELKKQKEYNWLNQICAWTLQEVVRIRVTNVWKKYKEQKKLYPKASYPREKTDKGWHDSFSIYQDGYKIKDNKIFLSQGQWKGKNEPKIIIPFKLTNSLKGTPKIITVSWKHNNWTVNISCDIELPSKMPKSEIKRMIGIDRNVRKLFATNRGWKHKNPKYWDKKLKWIKELRESLHRKQHKRSQDDKTKSSNNFLKTKLELKRLCEKVSNQVKDRNHKLTRKWVDGNDLIVFEDLKEAEMAKKKDKKGNYRKIGKWTTDAMLKVCWYQQANFTSYKAKGAGKWVEFVNAYNTSKRCSNCGKINKQLGGSEVFKCPSCDNVLDRDVNASRNILEKGIKKLRLGTVIDPLSAERI